MKKAAVRAHLFLLSIPSEVKSRPPAIKNPRGNSTCKELLLLIECPLSTALVHACLSVMNRMVTRDRPRKPNVAPTSLLCVLDFIDLHPAAALGDGSCSPRMENIEAQLPLI